MDWNEMTGRERDALIAVDVMDWPEIDEDEPYRFHVERGGVVVCGIAQRFTGVGIIPRDWRPTENVADAWDVVEKMEAEGWDAEIRTTTNGCAASFSWYAPSSGMPTEPVSSGGVDPRDGNVAYAICLAALRAKGVEV